MQNDIANRRLISQKLGCTGFDTPEQVVGWLGCVQSQDYLAGVWALGVRSSGLDEAVINAAYNDGKFLRTHIIRSTWHFVLPEDIRWIQKLTEARVHQQMAYYVHKAELDVPLMRHAAGLIGTALAGGRHMTRTELAVVLETHNLQANNEQMTHIAMYAELENIITSGPRSGKQFTYALLDERAPAGRDYSHEEALAELATRYFSSHGPATTDDFAWWSSLTKKDVAHSLQLASDKLISETISGRTYWFGNSQPAVISTPSCLLIPNYDEYIVSYQERGAIWDSAHDKHLDGRGNPLFQNTVVFNGLVCGTWRRTLKSKAVVVDVSLFSTPTKEQAAALHAEIERYASFLGKALDPPTITVVS